MIGDNIIFLIAASGLPVAYLLFVLYTFIKISEQKFYRNESSGLPPLWISSYPKTQALYRLHLPVIGAVEIRLCCSDMGMTH